MKKKDRCCQNGGMTRTERVREVFPEKGTFKLEATCLSIYRGQGKVLWTRGVQRLYSGSQ